MPHPAASTGSSRARQRYSLGTFMRASFTALCVCTASCRCPWATTCRPTPPTPPLPTLRSRTWTRRLGACWRVLRSTGKALAHALSLLLPLHHACSRQQGCIWGLHICYVRWPAGAHKDLVSRSPKHLITWPASAPLTQRCMSAANAAGAAATSISPSPRILMALSRCHELVCCCNLGSFNTSAVLARGIT